MATDIRGDYENNRRRTTDAVTVVFPASLDDGDLRAGEAATLVANGDYTGLTLPAGVIVTGVKLVVDEAFDAATTATIALAIGGTAVLTATDVKTLGLTDSTGNLPMLLTAKADLVGTFALVGAYTGVGRAKAVVEFTDFDGATMSYVSEL